MDELLKQKLSVLASTKELTPETFMKVVGIVSEHIESWKAEKVSELDTMVREWEATMGETDQTFYSLGIRRAIDVIQGESALNQLPVLEKEDTPNE